MDAIRVIDVVDDEGFRLVPPCADPGFDHRSCDFWEDADRGSKAARLVWLQPAGSSGAEAGRSGQAAAPAASRSANPFLADLEAKAPAANPFAVSRPNPFLAPDEDGDAPAGNPFAPPPRQRSTVDPASPRKLQLLGRGLGVVGSYAKVLLRDDVPAVYAQFGPLSAYPRAQRTRDLYPALPDAPLPAVITCIASTREARHLGLARELVAVVCADLEARGFAAVETYPEAAIDPDATSAATPAFWEALGFYRAADDARFPVMRREFA
jgi:ribosomal protein S18 acetylase RimI-like enzyme